MFTTKLTDQFTASLLKAVSGVLNEAKKCEGCDCAKCECDDEDEPEETKEGYMPTNDMPSEKDRKTAGNLSALLKRERAGKEKKEPNGVKCEGASYRDSGYRNMLKASQKADKIADADRAKAAKKMTKEETELDEAGSKYNIPMARVKAKQAPTRTFGSVLDEVDVPVKHLDRARSVWNKTKDVEAVKKFVSSVKEEAEDLDEKHDDVPFEGPYDKPGVRKDKYGNVIKNVAKHLAKKAMNAQKNEEVEEIEEKRGLWDNIHAKRKRIKAGSGERMRKPGSEGAPSAADLKASQTEEVEIDEVAPPGAKYERMVKHIKKAYAKDGKLTGKEKGIAYATAWKAKNEEASQTDEAFEQIDELSKATLGSYIKKADKQAAKAGNSYSNAAARRHDFAPDTPAMAKNAKKFEKRDNGAYLARTKLAKEEVEDLDELSKGTMGRYINKAATKMGSQGVTAGLKIAADEKSSKNFKDMGKREKGIKLAVNKLTKESATERDLQDHEPRKVQGVYGMKSKSFEKKFKNQSAQDKFFDHPDREGNYEVHYVSKMHEDQVLTQEEQDFISALNTDTLDEARGRPRKAGAKEFTINPRTKEKLMHDNPEHMKKIEALQRNGVIPVPKTEAGQHVVNQLTKAKLSMRGGETINFTHGEPHHVSGDHAAKLLTKYAGMKPDEKEAFQKKISHSHANLKSEL